MATAPLTVTAYLNSLPEDRRKALQALRKVIKANLDPRFREGIQYGMLGYFVPHSVYPAGYHCDPRQPLPLLSLASLKNHMALYLFCIYMMPSEQQRFAAAWRATGKRLDMGKSCVRFKKLDDVPLEVVGDTVARITVDEFVAQYERLYGGSAGRSGKATGAARTAGKSAAKSAPKSAAKKVVERAAKPPRSSSKAASKAAGRPAAKRSGA